MCVPPLIEDTQFEAFVLSASFHYGTICVLKCGERPETLETTLLTQTNAKKRANYTQLQIFMGVFVLPYN